MKKRYKSIFYSGLFCLTAFSISSCGDAFDYPAWQIIDDKQSDSSSGSDVELGDVSVEVLEGEMRAAMGLAIDFASHKYQYQRSTNIDVFAGYFTVSKSKFDFGQPLYHTYYYPNEYYGGPMGESMKLYPQLYHAYFYGEKHELREWKAVAQILYAYSMQELTDFYGAVPYNDFRRLKETYPLEYLSAEEAYMAIMADLDEAIATLKDRQPSAEALKRIEGEKSGFSKGNWKNWVKLANSMQLRMALNMVKVEPALAQSIAEKAVNDEIGVLLDADFGLPTDEGNTIEHPLYQINVGWNDSRLGASLENILKRYSNPLLEKWFSKNGAEIKSSASGSKMLAAGSDYVGMRQGCLVDPSPMANGYGAYSKFQNQYMPRTYFKVTEVLFLKAEGALRGWNMGETAQSLYEKGIRKVFDENNVGGSYDAYIKQEKVKPVTYKDYYKSEFNVTDVTRGVQVGVKWNNQDSDELKLEKIITQKYIAIFPFSAEAWTTFRRTGYPRLFPVPAENKWTEDDSFDVELQIRRIPYGESSSNDKINIPNVEAALGASNVAGTRLWWDVPTEGRDENNRIVPKNF